LLAVLLSSDVSAQDFTTPRGKTRTIDFTTSEGTFMSLDLSPDGQWIAFDLLGHIYRMPAAGGNATAITQNSGVALNFDPAISPDGRSIAFISDRSGQNNVWVMRADGTGARIVFADTETRFVDPAWAPDGKSVVAVRVYPTPGRGWHRQTTTLWRLPLDGSAPKELLAGRLMHYDAPAFSPDGKFLYFHVAYSTGEGLGLLTAGHRIQRLELATGKVINVRSNAPAELSPEFIASLRNTAYAADAGGDEPAALTPLISPDGTRMAFAREMPDEMMTWRGHAFRPRTALFVRDLASGTETKVLDPAAKDLTQVNAQYGYRPFPAYAWGRDGKSLIAWEGGQIRRVDVATREVSTIPFTARVLRVISEQTRSHVAIDDAGFESHFIQWPVGSPDGTRLAFVSAGRIYVTRLDGTGEPTLLAPCDDDEVQLTPAWSGDGSRIAYTTWSPSRRGHLMVAPASGGPPTRVTSSAGEFLYPGWMPDGSGIAVTRGPGPAPSSWNGWDAAAGWQVIRFAMSGGTGTRLVSLAGPTRFSFDEGTNLTFGFQTGQNGLYHPFPSDTALSAPNVLRSASGDGRSTDLLRFPPRRIGSEPVLSPDRRWIAFMAGRDLYASPVVAGQMDVQTDPNVEVKGRVRITTRGGIYQSWRDATTLQFASGNKYVTWDSKTGVTKEHVIRLRIARPRVARSIALVNARIVTADSDRVIERGTVLVRGERIACVGACDASSADSTIDLAGKTIIPGLVDLHAHHTGERSEVVATARPASAKALAWGVTSILDPAASSESVFPLSELQASGRLVGPRVYTTTELLIHPGIAWGDQVKMRGPSDAENEVNRRADWGAVSIKNFRQSRREQHQWLLDAARKRGITVTSEGGPLYFDVGLTMDGQTGWEHLIATLPVYSDAAQFFGRAGMTYSPTAIVAGHVNGSMRYYRSRQHLQQDPKFRRFATAADFARANRETEDWPLTEFSFPIIAEGLADIMRAGGHGAIGEHGEETGIGEHWELWAYAEALTPVEVIRAATIDGARFMGLDTQVGSITSGKLADLVVLNGNVLEDIRQSTNIAFVMQGGRIYDDDTLDQLWPSRRAYGPVPWSTTAPAGRDSVGVKDGAGRTYHQGDQ
jgi:Tol biopolymer transport system component